MSTVWTIIHILAAIWVIRDVIVNQYMPRSNKFIWILFAIFFSIFTAIIYYFVVYRPNK